MTTVNKKFNNTEPGTVDFSTLVNMLSYSSKHYQKEPDPNEESYKFWAKGENGGIKYSYDTHIHYIKKAISESGLENHVEISEQHTEKEFIQEAMYEYLSKHTITVKDLVIKVNDSVEMLHLEPLRMRENKPSVYNGGIRIKFERNKFIFTQEKPLTTNIFTVGELLIMLGNNAYVIFENNKFEQVNLLLIIKDIESEEKFFAPNVKAFIVLNKNIFNNERVTISNNKIAAPNIAYWHLKSDFADKISIIDKVDKAINTPNRKINILPEYVNKESHTQVVRIIDNKFTILEMYGPINFFFHGKNQIERIDYEHTPSIMQWDRSQMLDKEGKYALSHKKLFIELKKQAIENNDKFQELIFNREIIKCERKILKKELAWWQPTQDRIILFIGWLFSDHGTSWLRPLGWLASVNFAVAILSYCLAYPNSNFWYILWELFNPLSNLAETAKCEECANKNWLSFLNAFQKLFYAGMAYETIKVFRRFIAK